MDLSGEEKTIQALFHDLKAEDADSTPRFIEMWSVVHAKVGSVEPTRGLLKGFVTLPRLVMAAVLIGFVIAGVVIWPWSRQPDSAQDSLPRQLPNNRGNALGHQVQPLPDAVGTHNPKSEKRNKSVVRFIRSSSRKEVAISNLHRVKKTKLSLWQSPTAGLLRFPGDELLKNSPAFDKSAFEMRGFLSNLN